MRKLLLWVGLGLVASAFSPAFVAAQTPCAGTSGSATIYDHAWTADCVIAITAPDCVDSLGTEYECFEILGTSTTDPLFQSVAIFLDAAPAQGMTYGLGGTNGNGGLILGSGGIFVTAEAPYTGQVEITRYDGAGGIIECNFAFDARSFFLPQSANLVGGQFSGRLVRVTPATWSTLKLRYR